MLSSYASPAWEKVYYNEEAVVASAGKDPEIQVKFDSEHRYFDVSHDGELVFIPSEQEASLWELCDTIPDAARETLSNTEGATLNDSCTSLLYFSDEDIANYDYLDMLMHLSRSGVACAVTALICVIVASCLGLFAAARQQIVFAMVAGVCFFASSLYTVFAVVLILLRKSEILRDKRGIPAVLTAHRHVKSGWSMYVAWLVFVLTALTGGAWIALSLELRKTRASYNYNVKYKQICGT